MTSWRSLTFILGSVIIFFCMLMCCDGASAYLLPKYVIWTKLNVNDCFWDQEMCITFRNEFVLAPDSIKAEELVEWNQTYYQNCREVVDYDGRVTIHPCSPKHRTQTFYRDHCLKTANETGEILIVSNPNVAAPAPF